MKMPCPHFSMSMVQRSKGQSAVAGAAYQSGLSLYSEYDQQRKSYRNKHEVIHSEIMLPDHAPPEYADRQKLWNSAEGIEKAWNSQLARKIILALPREVPADQYVQMIREFCQKNFVDQGMCCDFAIHDKGDDNPHAHIMLTLRSLDEQGRWMPKARKEYVLDQNGERIRLPSGNWKTKKVPVNDWSSQKNCEVWRDSWERIQNRYLEQNQRTERVSLKSFERQGIDQVPTVHMGPAASHMEAKGVPTTLGDLNRDIRKTNRLLQSIRSAIRSIREWLNGLKEMKRNIEAEMEKLKAPTLSDLLYDYFQLRTDERSGWSASAQVKGMSKDMMKIEKCAEFLRSHGLVTVDDLHGYVDQLESRYSSLQGKCRKNERRIGNIDRILSAEETLRRLQPVHDAWMKKNFQILKNRYAEEHSDELREYRIAYRTLMKLNGESVRVDVDALKKEQKILQKEISSALPKIDTVRQELKQLRSVRYFISRVLPEEKEPDQVSVEDRMTAGRVESAQKDLTRNRENTKEKEGRT